jgi:tetratricopeptide (TPR) repeat protein
MSQPVMILFVGFLYIVVFGGYSYLRREGLSVRFAVEALLITGAAALLAAVNLLPFHPVFFLLLLYLVTMRVRLLVDLGNYFAVRGQFGRAQGCYNLARRMQPDMTGRLIVQVNSATLCMQQGDLDKAVSMFKEVLGEASGGHLGVKYEAAAHYNLGVAYRRKGQESLAAREFNQAIEAWPASEYARRAMQALEQGRGKKDTG